MEKEPKNSEVARDLGALEFIIKALKRVLPDRNKELKAPRVAADTNFEYALPYAPYQGPAPSAHKALGLEDKNT